MVNWDDYLEALVGRRGSSDLRSQLEVEQRARLEQYARPGFGTITIPHYNGGSMLEKLKNLSQILNQGPNVDALVELAAYGRNLSEEYAIQQIPKPKWLTQNLALLADEIKARYRAERKALLATAEAELEELRSKEEKRKLKEEEIERLRKELE